MPQAQDRTRDKAARLNFQCADRIRDDLPCDGYDVILAIDLIYFMGDYNKTLAKLNTKLRPGGRMIIAAFQAKEEGDPDTILLPGHTRMDEALQSDFEAEGNAFLCEARMAENGWFKDHAERETLVRFMYIIDQNADLARS